MSKNLYVSATEERSGKSAVVLGVMQMLLREIHKVAIFRPVINDPGEGADAIMTSISSSNTFGWTYPMKKPTPAP